MSDQLPNGAAPADAVLLLLLRVGALVLAGWGLLVGYAIVEAALHESSPYNEWLFAAATLFSLAAIGGVVWWLAPFLARRVARATLPASPVAPAAWGGVAIAVLGFWFMGNALAELASLPYKAMILAGIDAHSSPGANGLAFLWHQVIAEVVRLGVGSALVMYAGRIASWVARRSPQER